MLLTEEHLIVVLMQMMEATRICFQRIYELRMCPLALICKIDANEFAQF